MFYELYTTEMYAVETTVNNIEPIVARALTTSCSRVSSCVVCFFVCPGAGHFLSERLFHLSRSFGLDIDFSV